MIRPSETCPSRLSIAALSLLVAPTDREALLGDLEEEFRLLAASEGRLAARRWLRSQIIRSIAPLLCLRLSTARMARTLSGLVAGAATAIVSATLLGLMIQGMIGVPSANEALPTIALIVTGCALLSSLCGGWVCTWMARRRSTWVLAGVGLVVVAPDLWHASHHPSLWNPLFAALALGAAPLGLLIGGRLSEAAQTKPVTSGGTSCP